MNPLAVAVAIGLTTLTIAPPAGQAPDLCAAARAWADTTPWPRWVVSNTDAALLRRIIQRSYVSTGGSQAAAANQTAAREIRDSLGPRGMTALLALMTDRGAPGAVKGSAGFYYLWRLGFPWDSVDHILRSPAVQDVGVLNLLFEQMKETQAGRWEADTGAVVTTCYLATGVVEGWASGLTPRQVDLRRALLHDIIFSLSAARDEGNEAARTLLASPPVDRASSQLR